VLVPLGQPDDTATSPDGHGDLRVRVDVLGADPLPDELALTATGNDLAAVAYRDHRHRRVEHAAPVVTGSSDVSLTGVGMILRIREIQPAGVAQGAGSAAGLTSQLQVPASTAAGTGAAGDAAPNVTVTAGVPTGSAGETSAGGLVAASAGTAAGAGTAPDAADKITGALAAAAGVGTANAATPSVSIAREPGAATGIGDRQRPDREPTRRRSAGATPLAPPRRPRASARRWGR
jgi:hypothetical protein